MTLIELTSMREVRKSCHDGSPRREGLRFMAKRSKSSTPLQQVIRALGLKPTQIVREAQQHGVTSYSPKPSYD